jgi:hypothetical protein
VRTGETQTKRKEKKEKKPNQTKRKDFFSDGELLYIQEVQVKLKSFSP